MEQVETCIADVPPAPRTLVCESGKRAEIVAGWPGDQSQLTLLEGGTRTRRNAGYPLVPRAPCRWTLERQVRLIAGRLVLTGTVLRAGQCQLDLRGLLIGAGLKFA